jgi:la-related protein 1
MQPAWGYEYPISPATTLPYPLQQPFYEPLLISGVMSQIDYYFSEENLPKDNWLRRQMDSQGFVTLQTIYSFRRIQQIAPDVQSIRFACIESNAIDFVVGDDSVERIRRRNDWQRWVLPMEDRDDAGRSDGPVHLYYWSRHAHMPHFAPNAMPGPYGVIPAVYPAPNGGAPDMQPFPTEARPDHHQSNGHPNGNGFIPETQLSAAVPEFSPRGPAKGFGTFEGSSSFTGNDVLTPGMSRNMDNTQVGVNDYGVSSQLFQNGTTNGPGTLLPATNGVGSAGGEGEVYAVQAGDAFHA